MVHPSLRAQFNHISHHALVPGRAHMIKCTGNYGAMRVFTIHIQPEQHRAEQKIVPEASQKQARPAVLRPELHH
eukprot:9062136-Pyramimonas_sp.AAC.1